MARTPGPWTIETGVCRNDHPDSSADVTGTNEHGDVVVANCGCHDAAIDNARLIAAAPELLAAIRTMVYIAPENPFTIRDPRYKAWPQILASARAALLKAEGRQSAADAVDPHAGSTGKPTTRAGGPS